MHDWRVDWSSIDRGVNHDVSVSATKVLINRDYNQELQLCEPVWLSAKLIQIYELSFDPNGERLEITDRWKVETPSKCCFIVSLHKLILKSIHMHHSNELVAVESFI